MKGEHPGDRARVESIRQDQCILLTLLADCALRPAGAGRWKCLCPLHAEKSPSCHVSYRDHHWHWHCFGCNVGGDAIDLVRSLERCSTVQAIERLSTGDVKPAVNLWGKPLLLMCSFPRCSTPPLAVTHQEAHEMALATKREWCHSNGWRVLRELGLTACRRCAARMWSELSWRTRFQPRAQTTEQRKAA